MGIINSSDTSPSKADKMKAIISHFGTQEIGMDSVIQGKRLRQAIPISYGQMPDEELVINYLTGYIKPDLLPNKISGKMVPYINQNMINRLTYLQTGHALVFGSAINLPTLTKIEQASPKTDSDNAKISEKWYVD